MVRDDDVKQNVPFSERSGRRRAARAAAWSVP